MEINSEWTISNTLSNIMLAYTVGFMDTRAIIRTIVILQVTHLLLLLSVDKRFCVIMLKSTVQTYY